VAATLFKCAPKQHSAEVAPGGNSSLLIAGRTSLQLAQVATALDFVQSNAVQCNSVQLHAVQCISTKTHAAL